MNCVGPFAPHIAEELWHQLGHSSSVHVDSWPKFDEQYLVSDTLTIVVQVNGKLRATIEVASDAAETTILAAAREDIRLAAYLDGKTIHKSIYVPNKLVNFVVSN
jgi:leucyl-tRNA synthetase